VLESSDAVGGRVRTDHVDGFLLDRGFQVYLSAYPKAGKFLDLKALDLCRFRPGALVRKDRRFRRMMDVFRCPQHAISTAFQPIGSLRDKLLVGKLRLSALRLTEARISCQEDRATGAFMREYGFSEPMIDGFFRPFYGGIFLERELRTSSRMFQFTFRMFAEGFATVPAQGMEEIPRQLANRLPRSAIRLNSPVMSATRNIVALTTGERLDADVVVIATDAEVAGQLVPNFSKKNIGWRSVVGMYFAADQSPLNEAIIAVNGEARGLVNNVCVMSDVSPTYAPPGKSLVAVSVLGSPQSESLEDRVRDELVDWFGGAAKGWQHLRTYTIRKALPEQPPNNGDFRTVVQTDDGLYFCGDYGGTASIEGAIRSGITCAETILGR
jgi:phytoene dehydrogenase-like protein